MARVRPFRAWRYARPELDISDVCAPPYDVIDESQRAELLARDSANVVALELPNGPLDVSMPGNRYETGKALWDTWRSSGVLARDERPSVYVLEQRYTLAGREVSRRAFIAEVGLEPFDAGIVIPHERTLPKALGDRFELIKATHANLSQVFGLFDDPACETDAIFAAVMAGDPIARATDADGVESTLWAVDDTDIAVRLADFMAPRQVFIADGHHRYTTALAHRDLMRSQSTTEDSEADHDFVMMALVNMDDPDLVVLPYHRIADAADAFDASAFTARLAEYFDVTEVGDGHPSGALDDHDRVAFLFATRGETRPRLAVLRPEVDLDAVITRPHTLAWKSLDVAVLQELVLWPLLGIHPDHPETLERISFTKDAHACLKATADHDVAMVLRPTRLSQLREVSLSGETMPQKSTYFYPKLLSGLVFRSAE